MEFGTKAVHSGQKPEASTGAIMPPIYMTSTFIQESPGEIKGYDYTRADNPNFTILEELLASLENAKCATIFSSGLGALTAMISTLSTGDHVLAIDGLYGGTYRLFTQVFNRFGIHFKTIHPRNQQLFKEELHKHPKWLFFETPTNPLLEIFDIAAIATLAKRNGIKVFVDNTFATPFCQNPLELGADVVWHSTTKYLGGHSDVVGGVVMTDDIQFNKALRFARKAIGINPSPFDAWLTNRGVKTLAIRMAKHQENAQQVADFLQKHPQVKRVYYPGLTSHPQHEIARRQMKGFSGMVSVEFDLPLEVTKKLISSLHLFSLAESLGGVESLVCHPASMTHASIPSKERERFGIMDGLVRLSVGIEDFSDLKKDLEAALKIV
ncbi:MAG: trans-sulfuration enzyme family protein [Parachlamydiaceae bacterium]